MIPPIHIMWKDSTGSTIYHGSEVVGVWIDNDLVEGVLHPGQYSNSFTVVLQNTAQDRRLAAAAQDGSTPPGTPEKFVNMRLYLDADDPDVSDMLVNQWPAADGGVELSFDQGNSWNRINPWYGNPAEPTTWITLPGASVTDGAADGELGPFPPFNRATIQVRIKTPVVPATFGLMQFRVVPDCDVI